MQFKDMYNHPGWCSFWASVFLHGIVVGCLFWGMKVLYHPEPYKRIAVMDLVTASLPSANSSAASTGQKKIIKNNVPQPAPIPESPLEPEPVKQEAVVPIDAAAPQPTGAAVPAGSSATDPALSGSTSNNPGGITGRFVDAENVDGGLIALYKPEVVYPSRAIELGITGTFEAYLYINSQGLVDSVSVIRSPHSLITTRAIKTIKQWKFKSPRFQGNPVAVKRRQIMDFTLD